MVEKANGVSGPEADTEIVSVILSTTLRANQVGCRVLKPQRVT